MLNVTSPLYPLQFKPLFRSYIWGGQGLRTYLNKNIPDEGIWAESWEIVDHGADQSVVSSGPLAGKKLAELIAEYPQQLLGERVVTELQAQPIRHEGLHFPLLLKYLDCHQVLSVQVHPDDAYGLKMPQPDLGKTEAWYVVAAKPEAVVYAGLLPGVDRQALQLAVQAGKTHEVLHQIHPKAGDCIFIPAGTVHALGGGLIVAEIQQSSDTTFRLFDWNRTDASGRSRPLHIEQALEVIDYQRGPVEPQTAIVFKQSTAEQAIPRMETLVDCSKFHLQRLSGSGAVQIDQPGRFTMVTVPSGLGQIAWHGQSIALKNGDSVLLPAALEDVWWQSEDPNSVALIAR